MKCKRCFQTGFLNPISIRRHRAAGCAEVKVIPETQEIKAAESLETGIPVELPQPPADSVTAGEVRQAESIQVAPEPVETPPPVDVRFILTEAMNRLTGSEAKGAIFRMMGQPNLSAYDAKGVFQKLFSEIQDGDERAILRQVFQYV